MGPRGEVGPPPPKSLPSFPGQIYNLGTGTGYSVLQMVQAMEKASGKKVGWQPPCPTQPPALTYLMGTRVPLSTRACLRLDA